MGHQPTYPGGRHAPEIRQVRRRPLSNGVMTATHRDQPAPEPIRPWPAPGSDTTWWHGGQPEPVLTHRPSPARHRERPALPAAPSPEPAAAVVAPAPPAVPEPPPPIWEPDDRTDWAMRTMRAGRLPKPAAATPRRVRPPRATRRPLAGLTALVLLGLLAAFLAWFSAEPLWLSLGHSATGTATVRACPVHGIARTCADFTADGFLATKVTLLGTGQLSAGARVPARMVSATGTAAYVGTAAPRWVPSLLGVLLCGFGIAWLTGGYRLPGRRARLVALVLSLAGPLLITAGMLAVTW